jgi:hypothetical protein
LNFEVVVAPGPVASIVCIPTFPDRLRRGMVPWQLNVPFEAAMV